MHLPLDSKVHACVLGAIVESGAAPSLAELCDRAGASAADVHESLRRLADNHCVLLHPGTAEIWVAHPFSLSPANVWVEADRGGWWAPCMWCALGIAALVGDVDIHARAGGERDPITLLVRGGAIANADVVVHFSIPPSKAWDNVVHWCATVQPFRSRDEIETWCSRHRLAMGAIVPLHQVFDLARRWYGNHLHSEWRKWSSSDARDIFRAAGLVDAFWDLPITTDRF